MSERQTRLFVNANVLGPHFQLQLNQLKHINDNV